MSLTFLVIGAGAAGLAAARALRDRGEQVTVLEARDRLGGRAFSSPPGSPFPLELGAEFIHGKDSLAYRLVQQHGLTPLDAHGELRNYHYLRGAVVADADAPGPRTHRTVVGELFGLGLARRAAGKPDLSVGAALRELTAEAPPSDEEWRLWTQAISSLMAADVDELSLYAILEWTPDGPGGPDGPDGPEAGPGSGPPFAGEPPPIDEEGFEENYRIAEGYSALWEKLAAGMDVRLRTPVKRISWGAEQVVVEAGGQEFRADRVIITLPLGVLQAQAVEFSPPLPADKQQAIAGLGAGKMDKVLLEFDAPFWPEDLGDLITSLPSQLWWAPGAGRSGAPAVLTAFFGGSGARHFEALGEQTPGRVLEDLERMFQRPLKDRLRSARFVAWGSDPYSRMGYSFTPPGAVGLRPALAAPVGGVLFFAGEATHPTQSATIHGALESGLRAAEEAQGSPAP